MNKNTYLVLYHPEHDQIKTWRDTEGWNPAEDIVWRYLYVAVGYGWIVLGEL
jgi:hypothetical protein